MITLAAGAGKVRVMVEAAVVTSSNVDATELPLLETADVVKGGSVVGALRVSWGVVVGLVTEPVKPLALLKLNEVTLPPPPPPPPVPEIPGPMAPIPTP